ncbi:MAG: acetylglutamate kinase [Candidatus Orphnella occulta]|nr:acetylglutamate kinase [Candidatus Orphnella occulta]
MREQILKDSAKYIEQFKGKIFVIKYGGSMLDDKLLSDSVLDDIVSFYNNGIKIVFVHGGGAAISALMQTRGKEPRFVDGLRITDRETAEIVDDALTSVNKNFVERINFRGVPAESIVSSKSLTIKARKKQDAISENFLGDVDSIVTGYIDQALFNKAIPVVSPVGYGIDKKPYNINADVAAAEIAPAISAEKLILLTNVKGVMKDKDDEGSLISHINEEDTFDLIKNHVIEGGMIPKVRAGIQALDKGVKKVHIISGKILHSLLLEVFTNEGIGTEIVR